MPPAAIEDRLVSLEAGFNFRDMGGYETRDGATVAWGRLYRADALHRLTGADLTTLESLGLRVVIDLRSTKEIDDYGRLDASARWAAWHHRPIIDEVSLKPGKRILPEGEEEVFASPGEGYFRFLGTGEVAVSVLGLIAEADGPVVFHCTAGKDRTGMIAAMTLDLLGVPDETIIEDYLLTQETRARSTAWIEENEPTYAAFLAGIPFERRVMQADAIVGFLERVRDQHGSVEEFVLARGLAAGQIERLRKALLDDPAD